MDHIVMKSVIAGTLPFNPTSQTVAIHCLISARHKQIPLFFIISLCASIPLIPCLFLIITRRHMILLTARAVHNLQSGFQKNYGILYLDT